MTKTAYEIRADLLVLANKIALQNCSEKQGSPTMSEILAIAKQLNGFVSSADKQPTSR